ncbi:MAP9 protein, partial [Centropus bengalensis]|nr:MAP9 protein [Centropus bengalensis]
DQDQRISTSDSKLEENGRKSPSVIEVMMTSVYEKTILLEKSTDGSTDAAVNAVEGQIVTHTIEAVSVNDQTEHGGRKNTSKKSVKERYLISATINGKFINMFISWYFYSSLSSAHSKKKVKAIPSATQVSSQYLGTLKVLEDKPEQNSTEFDKADSLRAAIFQNWLEKKRAFLLEVKRIEKRKAEYLRNDAEKKEAVKREEAIASFEAWKKKKEIEAKKLNEKKKLEELKKKNKAAEESEEKIEAAQKVVLNVNEKKEEYIKQKKAEKILERRKQEEEQAMIEERNKKATEEYERWL